MFSKDEVGAVVDVGDLGDSEVEEAEARDAGGVERVLASIAWCSTVMPTAVSTEGERGRPRNQKSEPLPNCIGTAMATTVHFSLPGRGGEPMFGWRVTSKESCSHGVLNEVYLL
jgi:hypothetical protein